MKTTFTLIAAGIGLAAAQGLSSLPQCGQTCISNMLAIAESQFGCAPGNATCYCTNQDFGFGVRDCSDQSCPTRQDAEEVIQFGLAYCKKALGVAATASKSAASTSASAKSVKSSAVTTETLTNKKGKATGTTTIFTAVSPASSSTASAKSSSASSSSTSPLTNAKGHTTGHTVVPVAKPTGKHTTAKSTKSTGKPKAKVSSSSSSSTTGAAVPFATAAPGLIGAAALAILAL